MSDNVYVLPASFGQERLWLLEQSQPGNLIYNQTGALRIRGPLDVDTLRSCLARVIERHESLRTVFRLESVSVVQVVHPRVDVRMTVSDVDASAVDDAITELTAIPFDLAKGPLIRSHLLRVAPEEHVLVTVLHHAITDGWSTAVLLGELTALYAGRDLPELAVQYADYAVWQREMITSGALEPQLAYWRDRLAGAEVLRLPVDHRRTSPPTFAAAIAPMTVPVATLRSLRGLGAGLSSFMCVMAGYAVLLRRWTGQDDIVISLPTSGREQEELEALVGFFVNTLPVRLDLSADPTFAEVAEQVRDRCLEAYANAMVPFDQIVEQVQPERIAGLMPLSRVSLNLLNPPAFARIDGLAVEPLFRHPTHTQFDLAISFIERGDELFGELAGVTDLFGEAQIVKAAAAFIAILNQAAIAPHTRVSDLECAVSPVDGDADAGLAPIDVSATVPSAAGDGTPQTPAEQILVDLWTEVLELDAVSTEVDFYSLGGNSLRAIRVVTRAREQGLELSIPTVLGMHTIRQLAADAMFTDAPATVSATVGARS